MSAQREKTDGKRRQESKSKAEKQERKQEHSSSEASASNADVKPEKNKIVRVPKEPKLPSDSVGQLMAALTQVQKANPNVEVQSLKNTVLRMERQIKALSESGKYTAADFTTPDPLHDVMNSNMPDYPGHSLSDCALIVQRAMKKMSNLPKMVSGFADSKVVNFVSPDEYTVPPDGTGGWTEGWTVLFVTINQAPQYGVFVLGRAPDGSAWTVLRYILPERDPSKLGNVFYALGNSLTVSIPITLSSSNVVATGVVTTETATSRVGPLAVIRGKLQFVSLDHTGEAVTNTQGSINRVDYLNYLKNPAVSLRCSSHLPSNVDRVSVSGPDPTSSTPSSAFALQPIPFCTSHSWTDAASATVAGFTTLFTDAIPYSYLTADGTDQFIWSFAGSSDFNKHLWIGDLKFDCTIAYATSASYTSNPQLTVVLYPLQGAGGGPDPVSFSVSCVNTASSTNNSGGQLTLSVDTTGQTNYAPFRGRALSDIRLFVHGTDCSFNFSPNSGLAQPRLQFHDVTEGTDYNVVQAVNLHAGYVAKVRNQACVQVVVAVEQTTSEFTEPDTDLPVDLPNMQRFLNQYYKDHFSTLDFESGTPSNTEMTTPMYSAASFGRFMGRVGKGLKGVAKAGKLFTPFIPEPYRELASNVLDKVSSSSFPKVHYATDPSSLKTFDDSFEELPRSSDQHLHILKFSEAEDPVVFYSIPDGCSSSSFATSSHANNSVATKDLFFFPAVTPPIVVGPFATNSSKGTSVVTKYIISAVKKGGKMPYGWDNFFKLQYGVVAGVNGQSSDLACLLCNLLRNGFPVSLIDNAAYTGEVDNLVVLTSSGKISSVSFDLVPVSEETSKIEACSSAKGYLFGLFPDGWCDANVPGFAEINSNRLFPASKVHTVVTEAKSREGVPGKTFRIVASLN
jgi:hypothetical protein